MSDHVIDLSWDGWGLEHPAECKIAGGLLDCPVHKSVLNLMASLDGPPEPPGRYVVTDDGNEILFAPAAPTPEPRDEA